MDRNINSTNSSRICHLVLYLLINLVISTAVEARLKITPTDITTRPGEDVRFSCSTESLDSVDWTYRKEGQPYRNIFIGRTGGGGDKSNGYMINKRIDVDFDIPSGQYDLVIRNVTQTDEGEYVCYDISDQDSPASARLIIIITGELKSEFCSYDVAASVGNEVQLNFTTTQSHSIHLEHRSVDRSYPLHVFRDGKIVNDYYVLSGRFDVKVSAGVWTLVIKDVQMADAGTFICSEDNGLGKQDVRELIVLEWKNVSNGEACSAKNCTVRFAGNCPPVLEWRQSPDGENGKIRRIRSETTRDQAVITSTRSEDGDQELSSVLFCVAMTKSTAEHIQQRSFLVIQELSSCEVKTTNIVLIVVIIFSTFAMLTILLIWFIKRKRLRCQPPLKKPDDVFTPARQPMRGPSTPFDVVVNQEKSAAEQPLKFGTPIVSNTNGGDVPVSSTRRRHQNSANKENVMNPDCVNKPNKEYGKNAKAKRKLPLDNSFSNCETITDDWH